MKKRMKKLRRACDKAGFYTQKAEKDILAICRSRGGGKFVVTIEPHDYVLADSRGESTHTHKIENVILIIQDRSY